MSEGFRLYLTDTKALGDPQTYEECYQRVSAARQEKIDRMRMEQDKKLSLAAGLLLDRGLCEYGLRESEVRICKGEHGKPFLADDPDIHFSLSHSNEMAMAVFSDHEVGCDIEFRKRTDERLAKRFFCPEEYVWMMEAAGEAERKERFYRLWTLKESYLKMTGWGLRLPLDSFCFSFEQRCPDSRKYKMHGEDEAALVNDAMHGEGEETLVSDAMHCESVGISANDTTHYECEGISANDIMHCEGEEILMDALAEYGGKCLSEDSAAILHAQDGQPYGVFKEYRIGEYSAAVCLQWKRL